MTRFLLFLPVLALAACAAPEGGGTRLRGLLGPPKPEASAPLPPQVVAALPAGVPATVITRNADGCYLITLEVTDPPTGFPLTDAAGNEVCETEATDAIAAAEGAAPTDLDPLNPSDPA